MDGLCKERERIPSKSRRKETFRKRLGRGILQGVIMTICSRCILDDERISELKFNEKGECNFCEMHDEFEEQYPNDERGKAILASIIQKIKDEGKDKRYDCAVGVSGGCDSSYLLAKTVEYGLRPLAVHWNNNWDTAIAQQNIRRMLNGLDVDYYEYGMNREELDDMLRSFLYASTPDAAAPEDTGLTSAFYRMCEPFGIKYILNAYNFRTEGSIPLSWNYMDGRYVESVHAQFGSVPIKTFPTFTFEEWLYWMTKSDIKRPRLLYYMDYQKEEAKKYLHDTFGWEWYSGHHCENRHTIFLGNYLHPVKFNIDFRYVEFSAMVRSGQMTREEALTNIKIPPEFDMTILEEVLHRFHLAQNEFDDILKLPIKSHNDYPTYKRKFQQNKALFVRLLKEKKIPPTFYRKYVEGI